MDAKELRLGNYVKLSDEWNYREESGVIQWDERDWYAVGESTLSLDNVSPIPLDEQWLKDFGSEELVDFYDDVEKAFLYKDHYIILVDGEWFFGLEHQDFHTKIKYIHKLQNLFHALTGEELTKSQ